MLQLFLEDRLAAITAVSLDAICHILREKESLTNSAPTIGPLDYILYLG